MNDIFVFVEALSDAGRIALFALFALAVGFLVFDRRGRAPRLKVVRRSRDEAAA